MKARQKTDTELRKLDRDHGFIPHKEPYDNTYLFKLIFGTLMAFLIGALLGEGCTYIL